MAKQRKSNTLQKQIKADRKNTNSMAKQQKSIKDILPICDTHKNSFKYSDGSYMDIIQIKTKDLINASENSVNMDLYILTKLNKVYSDDYKIISVNFPTNTKTQQSYFQRKINHCSNQKLKVILQEKLEELEYAEQTSTNREHYIMVFGNSYEQLVNNYNTVISTLGTGLSEEISLAKKVQLLYMMANKSASIFYDNTADKYVARRDKSELVEKYGYNPHLLKAIQPNGNISFAHEDCIRNGSGYETCIYVYDFPKNVDRHWLNILTNNAGTITTIDVSNIDSNDAKKNLSKSIIEYKSQSVSGGNIVDKMDAKEQEEKLEVLAYEVSSLGEVLKRMTVRIFVSGKTQAELQRNVNMIMDNLEDNEYKAAININEQKYEWMSMYRSVTAQQRSYNKRNGKAIRSSTLAGGDPFHFTYLNDKYGSLLGHTTTSGIDGKVIFDLYHNDNMRIYYNTVAVGEMGAGKSTLLKKIMRDRAARGDYLRVIDVTGEFSPLALELGGKVVYLDGTQGVLNPLQVNKGAESENESFSMHLSKLSTMYKFIAPESSHTEKLLFEMVVRKLYESRHLTPKTIEYGKVLTDLPATEYPIMEDLLPVIDELIKSEKNLETQNYLHHIKLVVEDMCYNYGHIFNGHTSIDDLINTQIVVYNLRALSQMKKEIFNAQLSSALSLCWANAVKVGSQMKHLYETGQIELQDVKHFLLIIDESHKIINSSNPYAVEQVTVYAREGRKYFAGLMFASQSIRDYVSETTTDENYNKIKTLFELCCYKFIMRQDSNSIQLISEIFKDEFTETEIAQIPYLTKGQAILNIKSVKNITIQIDVTPEEIELFRGGV